MKNEQKEIADVAMEIVGDVAEKAHGEMTFKKQVLRSIEHHENFKDMPDVCAFLVENSERFIGEVIIAPFRAHQLSVHCKIKCDN